MWPLYLLLNKILKTEEENVRGSVGEHLTVVEGYPFEQAGNNEKDSDATMPRSHVVEVPLINQQHAWDCGIACILMVLRTLGIYSSNIEELEELCCTTSIWTVDLAHLLHKFSVSFSYFTVTLGANPNFSMETFYKEQLPNDLMRVDMLFHKALETGINIQVNLQRRNFFIDLVRKLYCHCSGRPLHTKSVLARGCLCFRLLEWQLRLHRSLHRNLWL